MLSTLLLALLAQTGNVSPAPTPAAAPAPAASPASPVYYGNPATRFALDARPLGFDPDGNARWLVVVRFIDAHGHPTRIMANSDVDYTGDRGHVQWQTRMRYGQPAAIIETNKDGPLAMLVRANVPKLGSLRARTDTRTWPGARVVAKALGPHLVQVGWFPQEQRLARLVRIDENGKRSVAALIAGPSSTFRDTHVRPKHRYRYILYRADRPPVKIATLKTPPDGPPTSIAMASGKAMWLFFSTNPVDANYYGKMNPQKIVAQAVRAGLHYVELRTAYGAYWQVTPGAKPTIDAIIDGLAAHGIGTMGWTVPRDTTFEDLAASLQTVFYRTAKGTPLTGLAIDVERGDEFMGDDPHGLAALWMYMKYLREAVGPKYLLVATIEDPYLEHLNNKKYPYRQIAKYSDVLQPMSYWRMMRRKPTTPAFVKVLLKASYDKVLYESGRKLPVSFGGQTTREGRNGNPPADEIIASLEVAKQVGAIGECFFDWDGTQPYQWDALAAYRW